MSFTKSFSNGICTNISTDNRDIFMNELTPFDTISTNQILYIGDDDEGVNHRINFGVSLSSLSPFSFVSRVVLKLHSVSGSLNDIELCRENSITSDEGVHLDYFKTNPTELEIDLTKYITSLDDVSYFSIRTSFYLYGIYNTNYPTNYLKPTLLVYGIDGTVTEDEYLVGRLGENINYNINKRNGKFSFSYSLIQTNGLLDSTDVSLLYDINQSNLMMNLLQPSMPLGFEFSV